MIDALHGNTMQHLLHMFQYFSNYPPYAVVSIGIDIFIGQNYFLITVLTFFILKSD